MKTVFPNREIPHKWAHATQDHARGSNFSFQGDTLYSYSTPVARIYGDRLRDTIVLFTNSNYSATTAKQLGYARTAARHLPCVAVPYYIIGGHGEGYYYGSGDARTDHKANLDYLAQRMAEELTKAQRAKSVSVVERRRIAALTFQTAAARYMAFFGIRRKPLAILIAAWDAAKDRAHKLENPDPASLDKRERAAAQRVQTEYATRRLAEIDRELRGRDYSDMARRSDWRLHGPWDTLHNVWRVPGPCMLRVDGDEIETSQGVGVPLAAAPMVWNLVQRAVGAGGFEPSRSLGRLKIGDYLLDRIDADGTLYAGCHVIPYSELEVMARALELT